MQEHLKWLPYSLQEIPPDLSRWILFPGSFMERLRQQGAKDPRVDVLQESWQYPLRDEKKQLNITSHSHALVREVLIYSNEQKWMFARTVIPRSTLTGEQQCLAHLQNRSLGSVLFNDPTMERSQFEVACVTPDLAWHTSILEKTKIAANELWARRSRFVLQNKPLLLTEVFLPDIYTL